MSKKNCRHYFVLFILTIGIGLLSRTSSTPDFIYPYIGDAFYALMIYFLIGFLFPSYPSFKTFLASIGSCSLIEVTQLYDADWIVALRQTRIGTLILDHGFLSSDLLSYLIGGYVGFLVELKLLSRFQDRWNEPVRIVLKSYI